MLNHSSLLAQSCGLLGTHQDRAFSRPAFLAIEAFFFSSLLSSSVHWLG